MEGLCAFTLEAIFRYLVLFSHFSCESTIFLFDYCLLQDFFFFFLRCCRSFASVLFCFFFFFLRHVVPEVSHENRLSLFTFFFCNFIPNNKKQNKKHRNWKQHTHTKKKKMKKTAFFVRFFFLCVCVQQRVS